jgi:Tfp pilus assembly protein PilX
MKRRLRTTGDRGATLVLVLILITATSLVMGAVMSLANTNERTTVALRNQAAAAYAVDGAGQAAVNQLRAGTFDNANCNTTTTESLSNFFTASRSAPAASVAIKCTPDPSNGTGGGGGNSSPGSAILTLGNGSNGEKGIYVNTSNNLSVKVNGGIFSNSSIFLEGNKSNLENVNTTASYVYAMGACLSSGTSQIISTPPATCNYSTNPLSATDRRGMDPGTITGHGLSFDAPPAPSVIGSALPATCTTQTVYEFQPGLYASAAALNALTNAAGACSGSVWHFNPGNYYFNFQDVGGAAARKWTVSSGYLVGGSSTATAPLTVAKVAAQQAAKQAFCVAPAVGGPASPATGVEFIFGGDSRMDVTKGLASANPNVQICASNAASGPPIAFYGLKTAIGSGAFAVPAESGCVVAPGYTTEGGDTGADPAHCAVLQTYNDPSPGITIYGTTYVPKAVIDLYLNNNTVQVFRWGLVTRELFIGATGSPNLATAVIDVPADAPLPFAVPNLMYLDVYVCPGASTCSATGPVRLRAKVQLSTTTPTTATVLSWSEVH